MLFQYIGDGKDSPETTTVFGYKFELNGSPVDVVSENAINKLKGNSSFVFNPRGDTEEEIEAVYSDDVVAPTPKPRGRPRVKQIEAE